MSTCEGLVGLKPPYYTLIFSGSPIGDKLVAGYKTRPRRITDINVRQNFWANYGVLDARYPALVFEHEALVYLEEDSPNHYNKQVMDYVLTHIHSAHDPFPVKIQSSAGNDVVAFGRCYALPPEQNLPDEYLLYEAGVFRILWMGTSIPSVITTTGITSTC
jgi:hypothetical protein